MKLLATLWITSLLFAFHANAEVKLIREYLLKPPRDRRVMFAMAVTPEHDVLSFVPNDNGTWCLSRIRHWLDQVPLEKSLTLPGLAAGGREQFWGIRSQLLITPDGNLAVCIVSAYDRRERQEFASVVRLDQFKIVTSMRASALAEASGNVRTYRLDGRGHLVVNASTGFPRHPGDDTFFGGDLHKLATVALPGLGMIDNCEYSEWTRSGVVVRRENEGNCAGLLKHSGVNSLDELSKTFVETDEVMQTNEGEPPGGCAFLTYMSHISRDGRLRRELCSGGHRGFFGNFVVTSVRETSSRCKPVRSWASLRSLAIIHYNRASRPWKAGTICWLWKAEPVFGYTKSWLEDDLMRQFGRAARFARD